MTQYKLLEYPLPHKQGSNHQDILYCLDVLRRKGCTASLNDIDRSLSEFYNDKQPDGKWFQRFFDRQIPDDEMFDILTSFLVEA